VRSLAAVLPLFLLACGQEPTDPAGVASGERFTLTIGDGSSSAGGVVASDRGDLQCSITGATNGADASGACSGTFPAGSVVSVTATGLGGAVLRPDAEWGGTCTPLVEDPRTCQLVMDRDRWIAPTFVPAPNSFTLTVTGGAAGNGSVYSTPAGISCSIVDGEATAGNCAAGFPRGTKVKLTATAADGRHLKAWAGGTCDTGGDGKGKRSGSCVTTLARNVGVVVSFEAAAAADAGTMGEWSAPFAWPQVAINAALLPNRKVLTYGRRSHVPVLWDPAIPATFTDLALPADFFCSGFAFLRNGKLLVAGGHAGSDNFGLKVTYSYDQATRTWIRGTDMQNGRWYPTLTLLPTGHMLAISGGGTNAALNVIPEVYAPGLNTWRSLTTASRSVPYYPMMFVAPDGKVFYVGPDQQTAFLNTNGTGSWTTGPTRQYGWRDYGSAVMYDAGKILVVGGGSPTATAETIDLLGARTWGLVASMSVPRRQINATLLADGTVLVTGGTNSSGFNNAPSSSDVLAAERWDPANPGAWKQLARMSHHRLYHSTAILLPDARVLSLGSGEPAASGLTDDKTAEIFSPPYLFNPDGTAATRPVIASVPATVAFGSVFTVRTTSFASIAKVMAIRLSAVTHATNMNQRGNSLSFTVGTDGINVTAPLNAKLATPGHYLIFIVNTSGVPSVAKVITIG
jgi:hypothetical protein